MRKKEIFNYYREYITNTYTKIPLAVAKGRGSYLWDISGKKYLDFFPGFGASGLGHCHPKIVSAIHNQAAKLIFVANNFYHAGQAELAKELNALAFKSKVFFCNSGAEANETAIKFCRKFGQVGAMKASPSSSASPRLRRGSAYEIISFENSFHGRTLAALTATGQKKYQEGFGPLPAGFKSVPFNDIAAFKKAVSNKTVAVILELIQGEGGINVAEKNFVQGLRKICDEKNLLLIVDEVQTGIGRTGKLFCYQHYGVVPDIMTSAKSIAGGLPLGAVMIKKDIADVFGPGSHGSTFGGGPLVCRTALAVFKILKQHGVLDNVNKMGAYLKSKLQELKQKYPAKIKEVRGLGLMLGLELERPGKLVVEKCLKKQLLLNCTHDRVLRLMPALTVSKKEINDCLAILDNALSTVR